MRISDWSSDVCSSDLAGEGILAELLDAEADALLVDVDVEHLDLDDVTLAVLLGGFLARQVPVEVGEVHHAVDLAGQADEEAELGDVLDLTLLLGADRVVAEERLPRVAVVLLEAQAADTHLLVDVEDHHHEIGRAHVYTP